MSDNAMRVLNKGFAGKYVKRGGTRCIYCGTDQIAGRSGPETDAGCATQSVSCLVCGGEWTDVYRLVGVEPVQGSPD